jgi:hypothetical protein
MLGISKRELKGLVAVIGLRPNPPLQNLKKRIESQKENDGDREKPIA